MRSKLKWIFTLAAVLAFLILGSMIPDDGINARSMAVGMGFDVTEEGEFVVSAQILTSAEGTRVIKTQSEYIADSFTKLSEISGKLITVTHCNVILIGKKLLSKENFIYLLYTMLKNSYISDNAYILVTEDSAFDVLSSKTGFGENASLYLQKLIAKYGGINNISFRTISQCVVGQCAKGQIIWLPCVKKVEIDPLLPSSNSPSSDSGKKDTVYDITSLTVFKDGVLKAEYDEEVTKAVNYLLTEVQRGSENFKLSEAEICLYVLGIKIKKKFEKDGLKAEYELGLDVSVKSLKSLSGDYPQTLTLTEKQNEECAEKLAKRIEKAFDETSRAGLDVFFIEQSMYSKFGSKLQNFDIKNVDFQVKVKLNEQK